MENITVKQILEIDDISLKKLSNWIYKWWGKEEGLTKEACECYIKANMQKNKIPVLYGLFKNDKIIGMYTITYDDLTVRPDLYPWLSNVWIDKKERKKGYSKILLKTVKENAKKVVKEKILYGYTKHIGLYEKYGWEFIEEIDTFNKDDRIQRLYKLDL